MKKILSFMITAFAAGTLVAGNILSALAAPALEINRNTGIAIHDNAPVLTADNLDEFLKYFENSEDYVVMPDITDPRNTYKERLAKEAAETLERVGKGINEFYNEQYNLTTYLSDFVNDNVDKYNETADFTNMILIFFLPFSSWEMSMAATFNETSPWESVSSGVSQAFSFMGGSNVEVIRNDAHDYTVTYTNGDGENMTNHFKGNPEHGFQMISYKNGALNEILEYVQKDDTTHIWQSSTERLVMEFKNIASYPMNFSADEITQRFVRADESRTTEGSGLGLAIAKSYTELCNGKFEIILDGDMFKAVLKFKKY